MDVANLILQPNAFQLKHLTLYFFRRNLARVNTFLSTLDRGTLTHLHLKLEGNIDESDDTYGDSVATHYLLIGGFYMLKELSIDDNTADA